MAAAGFVAVTTAAVGTTKALWDGVSAAADYGDNIDKMSQKMGMSTDAYQEWDFIMQHCGTSIEAMQPAMKTLANAADAGNEAFERLGITQEELATLSQEDLFALTISRLQEMEEGTERTAIASDLLGRGATELGALLNTSAEDTEAMRQQVHDLGGVMSEEGVKAAAAFKDSIQNLQTVINGAKNNLSADFLPAVTQITDGLTLLFSGDDSGLEMITQGVDELVDKLTELIPQVMEVGGSIIESICQAILDNLPTLIETGVNIISQVITGLIEALPQLLQAAMQIVSGLADAVLDNLPLLIETALQMILAIANGLAQALPQLIPAIIAVVLQVATTLIDNLPMLIEVAITLFLGLVTGLIQAIPQIIAALPMLIDSIISALIDAIPLLIECGVQLFVALIENLPAIIVAIVKACPEIVNALVKGFMELAGDIRDTGKKLMEKLKEGIISLIPNLVSAAKDVGKNVVDGIWNGISSGWGWLKEQVGSLASSLFDVAKGALGISSPSRKFRWIGEMCVAGFNEGIDELMAGDVFGAAVNNSLSTVAANIGTGIYGAGITNHFNFYDTQTSPDGIRRRIENTMTFGMAGGI